MLSSCRNVLLGLSLLLLSLSGFAQQGSEQQIKAAYLANFVKYLEWPDSGVKATICLFGRDTLGSALGVYEGRSIAGREISIRNVVSAEQMQDCHVVFVPDTEDARFAAVLRWTDSRPILTVSDAEYFARQGGGVALVREDARLRFDVNLDTLRRGRIKVASPMLRLARQVIGGAP